MVIISLDGNIGAGKSTLLEAIRKDMPEVEVVQEPVGEWERLRDSKGRSLLQLFYEDKKRWSYTFQNCAILTRLNAIKQALANTAKKVLITERSVLTDRFVFAQMLRDSGDLNKLEWELYLKWFDTFATELPLKGVIHVTTGVKCSTDRIQQRGREGESSIPVEYLTALDAQHHKWLSETDLDVLRISTEPTISLEDNLARIRTFVEPYLAASRQASPQRPVLNSSLREEYKCVRRYLATLQTQFCLPHNERSTPRRHLRHGVDLDYCIQIRIHYAMSILEKK